MSITSFLAKAPDPLHLAPDGAGGLDPLGLFAPGLGVNAIPDPTKPPKYFVNPYLDNLTALNAQRVGRSSLVNAPGSNPLAGLSIKPTTPNVSSLLAHLQGKLGIQPTTPPRPGGPGGTFYTP